MKKYSKLSKNEIDKILYQLCLAIAETKDQNEAADLLRDLLSYKESEMIAKRLKIAELLVLNQTYEEIKESLKAGTTTIARVNEWLHISGEGYQRAIERTKGKMPKNISDSSIKNRNNLKKKFPAYYWPEILLENIIENSNKKQKAQIQAVINKLDKAKEKPALYRKIKKILKNPNTNFYTN